ncbi:hypothetical protein AQUCO_00800112v1 [Aquilegia coerulea]|uniref:Uncharacterized protein n=1 Tax=Aquilegia coerulea TaxID=218851 RepID=A0A2G5EHW0_AQUCA|nr:hypothetical protein AQUCO_00800112v1 [Aquilegia coerulea]PIA55157.1 hypothetical protein AQUCO_00800112v1 [Aquilegia coerulea]
MASTYVLPMPIISSLRSTSLPITTISNNSVKTLLISSSSSSSSSSATQAFSIKTNVIRRRKQCCQAYSRNSSREETTQEEKEELEEIEEISKATLIWRAIKLPIYSVALVPLCVGSAAAYLQAGVFAASRFFVLLASSVLIITWLNLSNDVYDFDTGADKNKRESVVNMVGSRTGTLLSAYALLVIGFMGLTWACSEAGNVRSILLLTCAIICGYIYQCPPFRLSYQGLGEPLCFAAFGPFATTAFYLLQSSKSKLFQLPLTGTVVSASLLVGFTTSLILFCSHFHQVDEDRTVAKMSPLVRIGTKAGSRLVKVAVLTLYLLVFTLGLSRFLPLTCIVLCAMTLPIGMMVVRFVEENHTDKSTIFMAKYYCVRLHALFGAALSFGLVAARILTKSYIPRPFTI